MTEQARRAAVTPFELSWQLSGGYFDGVFAVAQRVATNPATAAALELGSRTVSTTFFFPSWLLPLCRHRRARFLMKWLGAP